MSKYNNNVYTILPTWDVFFFLTKNQIKIEHVIHTNNNRKKL